MLLCHIVVLCQWAWLAVWQEGSSEVSQGVTGPGELSVWVEGLHGDTEYTVEVMARNSAGDSPSSPAQPFRTHITGDKMNDLCNILYVYLDLEQVSPRWLVYLW